MRKKSHFFARSMAMLLAGAMGVVSIPGELYAAALPESQLAKSKLVYFIDCGDESVDTVDEGESFGTNNSVTEQVYGADPKTGKQWGILDDVSDPLKNDPGTNKTNAVYTDWTWPEAVWGTKEGLSVIRKTSLKTSMVTTLVRYVTLITSSNWIREHTS